MIKFRDLKSAKPENGTRCIVKGFFQNKKEITPNYCMFYYDHENRFAAHRITKWAPMPEHIIVDPAGWKSEFRGDGLPKKSDWCLVCTEKDKLVHFAWFDEKTQDFPGYRNQVIAFMEISPR